MRRKPGILLLVCPLLLLSCHILDPEPELRYWFLGYVMRRADDSRMSDSLKTLYSEDAAYLALREIHRDEALKTSLVEVPDDLIHLFFSGLVHIYNAHSLAARDSVISMFEIHSLPYPELHSLIVAVDTTKDWVRSWKEGRRLTGNATIDDLMLRYRLDLDRYYTWPSSHDVAVLETSDPLNVLALAPLFDAVAGVIYAEPNGTCCDGNDITAGIGNDHVGYEFSLGWGDCPAGCIARHNWKFSVRYDGKVEFTGSSGDPVPEPESGRRYVLGPDDPNDDGIYLKSQGHGRFAGSGQVFTQIRKVTVLR